MTATALTMTAAEVAQHIGCSEATVRRRVRAGEIPNVGVNGLYAIPRRWVELRFAAAGTPIVLPESVGTFT